MTKRKMNQKSLEAIRLHGFKPGYDPRRNLGGRLRSPMTTALRNKAGEPAPDGNGKTFAELAADALFESALKGVPAAYDIIVDRLEGRPQNAPQSIDMSIFRDLPPLTPEEYERGLGPGRGFCNEWWARLTPEQLALEAEKIAAVLRDELATDAGKKPS